MNWEMIGALGEVFGAIAVVLTLVYLARQIRDSAAQDRRHQEMEVAQASIQNLQAFARDPALADIWLRGLRDPLQLDPAETVRFGSIIMNIFQTFEISFHFGREGGLHGFRADPSRNSLKDIVASPGVQEWWADRRHWYSVEFQAEVDRCIEEGAAGFLDRNHREDGAES